MVFYAFGAPTFRPLISFLLFANQSATESVLVNLITAISGKPIEHRTC